MYWLEAQDQNSRDSWWKLNEKDFGIQHAIINGNCEDGSVLWGKSTVKG